MKLKLAIFLLLVSNALAGVFVINSAQYNDGVEYLAPYNSTYNGMAIQSFCIELNRTVNFGTQFQVIAENLGDFAGPGKTTLLEAGYLMQETLLFPTDVTTLSYLNRAIWFLTTPDAQNNPYLNTPQVAYWVNWAQGHPYTPGDERQFEIYIWIGDPSGQNQMGFASQIPEPATWALMCVGLIVLVGFRKLVA